MIESQIRPHTVCDPTCSVAGINTFWIFIAVFTTACSTCYLKFAVQYKLYKDMITYCVNITQRGTYLSRRVPTKTLMSSSLASRPVSNEMNAGNQELEVGLTKASPVTKDEASGFFKSNVIVF